MILQGNALCVGDNINTDLIIAAHYLVTTDQKELGKHCLEGVELNWSKKVKPGDILVAGADFGSGSSREHAPAALLGAGISAVIAVSFARILYRNSYNIGLPLLEIGKQTQKIREGDLLKVDISSGRIVNQTSGEKINFKKVPEFMLEILNQGGLANYVRREMAFGR